MNTVKLLKESLNLVLSNKISIIFKIVPIILFFSVFDHVYIEILNDLGFASESLFTVVNFIIEIIISSLIIYFTISVFLNSIYKDRVDASPSVYTILILFISHLIVGIASAIGYLLFFIPGLLVIVLSIYYPIFIIKYEQGPLEAISNSVVVVKKRLIFTSMLIGILTVCFMGLQIARNKLISMDIMGASVVSITTDAFITILYTYVYAVVVVMFKISNNSSHLK